MQKQLHVITACLYFHILLPISEAVEILEIQL